MKRGITVISGPDDIPLPESIREKIKEMGISSFYPPQAEALEHVFAGKSLVLSIPTASGKSLVAYLAVLRGVLMGGKALYIVPLRALASEKYEEIASLLPQGYRAVLSIGDYEESDKRLRGYDVIVATSEKADSLFRHRPSFLREFSVVVADEVHLLTTPHRGHILEVLLTRLKQLSPETQLIALSATIPNSEEIADWLGAAHLKSEWRPVKLREGVFFDGVIQFRDGEEREIEGRDPVKALVKDALKDGGQCLVFVNTRRSTESAAKALSGVVSEFSDRVRLKEISDMLISAQEEPTEIVERLAKCVEKGAGFHHAGLGNTQRKIIEKAFKRGDIKALAATPTLAAGINLPARRVIIRDLYRYTGKETGNRPIPNLELKQMAGRAGRPGYDPYGEAIFRARNQDNAEEIMEEIINGETERIESKLGIAPVLRIHIISSIASGFVENYRELMEFLDKTLFSYQFGVRESVVQEALSFLRDNGMLVKEEDEKGSSHLPMVNGEEGKDENGSQVANISPDAGDSGGFVTADRYRKVEEDSSLKVTPFGRLVSDLYIDPKSAVVMRKALDSSKDKTATELSYLHAISATPDMLTLYAREGEIGDLLLRAEAHRDELFLSPEMQEIYGDQKRIAYELFAEELKTALLLNNWINEVPENTITKAYGIGPGDIRARVDTARWLLHAMERIAALFHYERRPLNRLIMRITYGVKEELLPLVELKGVGRVRARLLYSHGYRDIGRLKRAEVEELVRIPGIGKATIYRILEQIGRDTTELEEAEQEIKRLQRRLSEFGIVMPVPGQELK